MKLSIKPLYALLLLIFLSGCTQNKQPLKIATNTWIGYEPLYVIEQLNLTDSPIKLTRKQNATDVMKLFESGEVDMACLTLDEAMT